MIYLLDSFHPLKQCVFMLYTFFYGTEIMFPGAQGHEDDTEVSQILSSLPDGKPFLWGRVPLFTQTINYSTSFFYCTQRRNFFKDWQLQSYYSSSFTDKNFIWIRVFMKLKIMFITPRLIKIFLILIYIFFS